MPASKDARRKAAVREARHLAARFQAREPVASTTVHAAIATLIPLTAKAAPGAAQALAALGSLAPFAAAKLAGWPWRSTCPATQVPLSALPEAIAAVEAIDPPWASTWFEAGFAATKAQQRRALFEAALERHKEAPEPATPDLAETLAQAAWADADQDLCEALREITVLSAALAAKSPTPRAKLRLQAMLAQQAVHAVATRRAIAISDEAIGTKVRFDPNAHEAAQDTAQGAKVRIIAPAIMRQGIVIVRAVVAKPPPKKARKAKKSKNSKPET
ncbi:MAG: hypothetical protein ACOYKM_09620 [Caulobacterales bacterium]